MQYRDVEYSVGDTGNNQWRWKIHRRLGGAQQPALFGVSDTQDEATRRATTVIDSVLAEIAD